MSSTLSNVNQFFLNAIEQRNRDHWPDSLGQVQQFFFSLLFAVCAFTIAKEASAQFGNIINIPPEPNVGPHESIGSDTQLNLFDGGRIDSSFRVGMPNGSASNVELNIRGGSIGDSLMVYGGTLNMSGGAIDEYGNFDDPPRWRSSAQSFGTSVNISGGKVGYFDATDGSDVNVMDGILDSLQIINSSAHIQGGDVDSLWTADGQIHIAGGVVGYLLLQEDSIVIVSGGRFGGASHTVDQNIDVGTANSIVRFVGGEFRLNGQLISGLNVAGDTQAVDGTYNDELSGTLSDGTPFATPVFAGLAVEFEPPPAHEPDTFVVPADAVPVGVRDRQTLVINEGAEIGDAYTAGWGSTVVMNGGQIGRSFKVVGGDVTISGGTVGDGFEAYAGSAVKMSGGSLGKAVYARSGSTFNISGGSVGQMFTSSDSVINISGGTIGDHTWARGEVVVSGGKVGDRFLALGGSQVTILGGEMGSIDASDDSHVTVVGSGFLLDGHPIDGLEKPGDIVLFGVGGNPFMGTLTGTLLDRSEISLQLTYDTLIGFSPGARLQVIHAVPEPSCIALLFLGGSTMLFVWMRQGVDSSSAKAISSVSNAARSSVGLIDEGLSSMRGLEFHAPERRPLVYCRPVCAS